jgi:nucleoid DNA-binding protein
MPNLTKKHLIDAVQKKMGYPATTCTKIVESFLTTIKGNLAAGESVKIANFGTLKVQHKKSRLGRNPHTGERMVIGERQMVSFKTGKKLKGLINR